MGNGIAALATLVRNDKRGKTECAPHFSFSPPLIWEEKTGNGSLREPPEDKMRHEDDTGVRGEKKSTLDPGYRAGMTIIMGQEGRPPLF
jgi:hypothetical protein